MDVDSSSAEKDEEKGEDEEHKEAEKKTTADDDQPARNTEEDDEKLVRNTGESTIDAREHVELDEESIRQTPERASMQLRTTNHVQLMDQQTWDGPVEDEDEFARMEVTVETGEAVPSGLALLPPPRQACVDGAMDCDVAARDSSEDEGINQIEFNNNEYMEQEWSTGISGYGHLPPDNQSLQQRQREVNFYNCEDDVNGSKDFGEETDVSSDSDWQAHYPPKARPLCSLRCSEKFRHLSVREKLCLCHLTQAAWAVMRLLLEEEASPECMKIAELLLTATTGRARTQVRPEGAVTAVELKYFYDYLVHFWANMGNRDVVTGRKFIPRLRPESFEKVLVRHASYFDSSRRARLLRLYEEVREPLYSTKEEEERTIKGKASNFSRMARPIMEALRDARKAAVGDELQQVLRSAIESLENLQAPKPKSKAQPAPKDGTREQAEVGDVVQVEETDGPMEATEELKEVTVPKEVSEETADVSPPTETMNEPAEAEPAEESQETTVREDVNDEIAPMSEGGAATPEAKELKAPQEIHEESASIDHPASEAPQEAIMEQQQEAAPSDVTTEALETAGATGTAGPSASIEAADALEPIGPAGVSALAESTEGSVPIEHADAPEHVEAMPSIGPVEASASAETSEAAAHFEQVGQSVQPEDAEASARAEPVEAEAASELAETTAPADFASAGTLDEAVTMPVERSDDGLALTKKCNVEACLMTTEFKHKIHGVATALFCSLSAIHSGSSGSDSSTVRKELGDDVLEDILQKLPWPQEFHALQPARLLHLDAVFIAPSLSATPFTSGGWLPLPSSRGFAPRRVAMLHNVVEGVVGKPGSKLEKSEELLMAPGALPTMRQFRERAIEARAMLEMIAMGSGRCIGTEELKSGGIEDPLANEEGLEFAQPLQDAGYKEGESFEDRFDALAPLLEACRVAAAGLHLSLCDGVLEALGFASSPEEASELAAVIWRRAAREGLEALVHHVPEDLKTKWGNAHSSRARFALLAALVDAGEGLISFEQEDLETLLLSVDCEKIHTVGRRAVRRLLLALQAYKSFGDVEAARRLLTELSTAEGADWDARRAVVRRRPRAAPVFVHSHMEASSGSNEPSVREFPASVSGMIESLQMHFKEPSFARRSPYDGQPYPRRSDGMFQHPASSSREPISSINGSAPAVGSGCGKNQKGDMRALKAGRGSPIAGAGIGARPGKGSLADVGFDARFADHRGKASPGAGGYPMRKAAPYQSQPQGKKGQLGERLQNTQACGKGTVSKPSKGEPGVGDRAGKGIMTSSNVGPDTPYFDDNDWNQSFGSAQGCRGLGNANRNIDAFWNLSNDGIYRKGPTMPTGESENGRRTATWNSRDANGKDGPKRSSFASREGNGCKGSHAFAGKGGSSGTSFGQKGKQHVPEMHRDIGARQQQWPQQEQWPQHQWQGLRAEYPQKPQGNSGLRWPGSAATGAIAPGDWDPMQQQMQQQMQQHQQHQQQYQQLHQYQQQPQQPLWQQWQQQQRYEDLQEWQAYAGGQWKQDAQQPQQQIYPDSQQRYQKPMPRPAQSNLQQQTWMSPQQDGNLLESNSSSSGMRTRAVRNARLDSTAKPKRPPSEFLPVAELEPDKKNLDLEVQVCKVFPTHPEIDLDENGRNISGSEWIGMALVGDETGTVQMRFTQAQQAFLQPGHVIQVFNAQVSMVGGRMRLEVGARGGIARSQNVSYIVVKRNNNVSNFVYRKVVY